MNPLSEVFHLREPVLVPFMPLNREVLTLPKARGKIPSTSNRSSRRYDRRFMMDSPPDVNGTTG